MARLGVNIDHIATLRQVRGTSYPDPLEAVRILVDCRVDQITCHLREDRRHIQDHDLARLLESKVLPVNLEMALTDPMVKIACKLKPQTCTLVPEKRQELTTEGGLNLLVDFKTKKARVNKLVSGGRKISLFIDPECPQIDAAIRLGADAIELHTGSYCEVFGQSGAKKEFARLKKAAKYAKNKGLKVFAGHGLNYDNLKSILEIKEIEEYNIGHSIVAKAVFVGLKTAVLEMQKILHS